MFVAWAVPQTPLGEVTVLPMPPSWIKGGLLLRGGAGRERRRGEGKRGVPPSKHLPVHHWLLLSNQLIVFTNSIDCQIITLSS